MGRVDAKATNNWLTLPIWFPPRASPPLLSLTHALTLSHTPIATMPAYVAVALTAAALGASWGARAKLLHAVAVVLSAAQVRERRRGGGE